MSDTEERLILLQERLEGHITEFKDHELEERNRWDQLIDITEANAKAVGDLTEATKGVVEVWQTSTNLGRFVKWLSGFAVVVTIATWWVKTFFSTPTG